MRGIAQDEYGSADVLHVARAAAAEVSACEWRTSPGRPSS